MVTPDAIIRWSMKPRILSTTFGCDRTLQKAVILFVVVWLLVAVMGIALVCPQDLALLPWIVASRRSGGGPSGFKLQSALVGRNRMSCEQDGWSATPIRQYRCSDLNSSVEVPGRRLEVRSSRVYWWWWEPHRPHVRLVRGLPYRRRRRALAAAAPPCLHGRLGLRRPGIWVVVARGLGRRRGPRAKERRTAHGADCVAFLALQAAA